MKKKVIKKLNFKKELISNLSNEETNALFGGYKPTFVDYGHGGYCTNGCGGATAGAGNCTSGCTSGCPSVAGAGCESQTVPVGCLPTVFNGCHTDRNCTYAQCTGGCPNTINDATCGCV